MVFDLERFVLIILIQDIFFDFASEASEHLETAESKLLELESNSEDKEVINAAEKIAQQHRLSLARLELEVYNGTLIIPPTSKR